MTFLSRKYLLTAAAFSLPLALAACGSSENSDAELAQLDDNLTSDPAMKDALEDSILVDPDLTDQSNKNAVRGPNSAANGAVPPGTSAAGAVDSKLTGTLMAAPAPTQMASDGECSNCAGSEGMTLGAKAKAQNSNGNCLKDLTYDMGWATRMPAAFPVYPRANLQEAAGVEGGKCNIRVVSFTTPSAIKSVVDYYYTQAKRSGYSAEYVMRGSEHVLGGTRDKDGSAYVITLNNRSGGGAAVDIVANNGR